MKNKYLFQTIFITLCFGIMVLLCITKPSTENSISERRKLAQFPELTTKTILSGEFMTDFEKYTLDQFPFRDSFRTLKAVTGFYVLWQKDINDIYMANGYAAKLEYPLNENSVTLAGEKISKLYEKYMKDKDMRIFLSVVPDKGYFLAEKNGYPSMDYEKLLSILKEGTEFAEYIDIMDLLDITDYYKTDTHWRQENITDVADRIAEGLSIKQYLSGKYEKKEAEVPFYGVYYGQSALPLPSEKIFYLTNEVIDNCRVYNFETDSTGGIYNMDKLNSKDCYEMFLSGAAALLTIENDMAETDRELIVFRDSFGSSLIPLLAEGYRKITIVDTRYITSDFVGHYVEFTNQDVLFMYSTLLLNSSEALK